MVVPLSHLATDGKRKKLYVATISSFPSYLSIQAAQHLTFHPKQVKQVFLAFFSCAKSEIHSNSVFSSQTITHFKISLFDFNDILSALFSFLATNFAQCTGNFSPVFHLSSATPAWVTSPQFPSEAPLQSEVENRSNWGYDLQLVHFRIRKCNKEEVIELCKPRRLKRWVGNNCVILCDIVFCAGEII